jgi:hypothetical protein
LSRFIPRVYRVSSEWTNGRILGIEVETPGLLLNEKFAGPMAKKLVKDDPEIERVLSMLEKSLYFRFV